MPDTAVAGMITASVATGIHCDGTGQDAGYNITVRTYDKAGDPADMAFMVAVI